MYKSEYTLRQKVLRQTWSIVQVTVFGKSPRLAFGYRRWLLRSFGARIGRGVKVEPTVTFFDPSLALLKEHVIIGHNVDFYNVGTIELGQESMVSRNAQLCSGTHDYTSPRFNLMKKKIVIGDRVWICAGAFIGPGVNVGDEAVIAAHAVVTNNVEKRVIAAGNPAKTIKNRVIKPNT